MQQNESIQSLLSSSQRSADAAFIDQSFILDDYLELSSSFEDQKLVGNKLENDLENEDYLESSPFFQTETADETGEETDFKKFQEGFFMVDEYSESILNDNFAASIPQIEKEIAEKHNQITQRIIELSNLTEELKIANLESVNLGKEIAKQRISKEGKLSELYQKIEKNRSLIQQINITIADSIQVLNNHTKECQDLEKKSDFTFLIAQMEKQQKQGILSYLDRFKNRGIFGQIKFGLGGIAFGGAIFAVGSALTGGGTVISGACGLVVGGIAVQTIDNIIEERHQRIKAQLNEIKEKMNSGLINVQKSKAKTDKIESELKILEQMLQKQQTYSNNLKTENDRISGDPTIFIHNFQQYNNIKEKIENSLGKFDYYIVEDGLEVISKGREIIEKNRKILDNAEKTMEKNTTKAQTMIAEIDARKSWSLKALFMIGGVSGGVGFIYGVAMHNMSIGLGIGLVAGVVLPLLSQAVFKGYHCGKDKVGKCVKAITIKLFLEILKQGAKRNQIFIAG